MAALQQQLHVFTQARCKVVVLSFGSSQGADAWIEATGCELEVYLDPDRRIYSMLGLERSLHKVWNMDTVHFYAQQKALGRQLPQSIVGVEDDPLQMGGDFTIRRDGRLVLSYPSKTPKDRPSTNQILQNLPVQRPS